jgi:hypothetical protein
VATRAPQLALLVVQFVTAARTPAPRFAGGVGMGRRWRTIAGFLGGGGRVVVAHGSRSEQQLGSIGLEPGSSARAGREVVVLGLRWESEIQSRRDGRRSLRAEWKTVRCPHRVLRTEARDCAQLPMTTFCCRCNKRLCPPLDPLRGGCWGPRANGCLQLGWAFGRETGGRWDRTWRTEVVAPGLDQVRASRWDLGTSIPFPVFLGRQRRDCYQAGACPNPRLDS